MKRLFGAGFAVVISAFVMSACFADATSGSGPSSGPSGGLGAACHCTASQARECDGAQGGCQEGLVCVSGDVTTSSMFCSRPCPCPIDFVCKAFGHLGGKLLCAPDK